MSDQKQLEKDKELLENWKAELIRLSTLQNYTIHIALLTDRLLAAKERVVRSEYEEDKTIGQYAQEEAERVALAFDREIVAKAKNS